MLQCAVNGRRTRAEHPSVPLTPADLAADARACLSAGATSLHMHPRDPGRDHAETLAAAAHDAAVRAVRAAAPELEISCSTQEDIDLGDHADRAAAVRAWTTPPDLVSLNLSQDDAVTLGAVLLERGIGIEAGLASVADARALLAAPWAARVTRILVETVEQEDGAAEAVATAHAIDAIVAVLDRPRLWHGYGPVSWTVVEAGLAAGHSVRVGLEDIVTRTDGSAADANPGQVATAAAMAASARR
jgi:uncharacterized protein (DUF849 family)